MIVYVSRRSRQCIGRLPGTRATASNNSASRFGSADNEFSLESVFITRHTKWLWTGLFALPLLLIASALILLELNKGTLRIETNSEHDVPIRITQGDEIVDELIVTNAGASMRLTAGKYVIEVDGDNNGLRNRW